MSQPTLWKTEDGTSEAPLAGLRVVDMADEKGETCGRFLADLGADVIRVEPPGGAASRRLPPFHGATSLSFAVRNANKRGVTLDLGAPGDRDASCWRCSSRRTCGSRRRGRGRWRRWASAPTTCWPAIRRS